MDLSIHLARPEDHESILEVQALSLRELLSDVYNTKQVESLVSSQKSYRLETEETIFVAYIGTTLVGFAAMPKYEPIQIVNGIFVHPDYTHLGIGTRLLKELEKVAIREKKSVFYVMSSLSAVGFYQANGYQITNSSRFQSEGNVWISCKNMRKRLIPLTRREKWMRRIIFILIGFLIALFLFP